MTLEKQQQQQLISCAHLMSVKSELDPLLYVVIIVFQGPRLPEQTQSVALHHCFGGKFF